MRTVVQDGTALRRAPESPTGEQTTPVPGASFAPQPLVDVGSFLGEASKLGTKDEIQAELDAMAAFVRRFYMLPADQVLIYCGAFTARLTELAVLLSRHEAYDRQYTKVRTQQVQRWLDELENQMRIASRLIEVKRQDLFVMGSSL